VLDRDLVVAVECDRCRTTQRVMQPLTRVTSDAAVCPACGEGMRPALVQAVAADGVLAGERLAALGIPPYDIVRVAGASQERAFLLAADRPPPPP
jgi:hypothetical protein